MMTIKEFAKLCGCSTQTLRYYDRIHLLKPVKVDEWTGYRYYKKQQAIDFVKIKNLQLADFSIDEIKHLLRMSDIEIAQAFEDKITQQKEKLEKIQ
ncbi:MAG: MerR family transcriptional regulator [Erysipelotrichaceae bacterium]|nr:MerR family transcriptional regulator [Erysipelotrichaceae bacterium]